MGRGDKSKLTPLFSKYLKQKQLIGFDVETHGKNNDFYMGGLYFPDKTYKSFYTKESLIRELKKRKYFTNTYVVATNLGFDLPALYFNTPEWNCQDIIMSSGRMISSTTTATNKQKLTYIDTFNHAPFSVATMGEILKIPKLKTPISMHNDGLGYARKPLTLLEKTELEVYNKRDCEITYKFMEFLAKGYYTAGGKLKLTIASTSLDIFRRKYLRRSIYKEYNILGFDPNPLIFESYYGGRTENFKRGKIENMNFYDVNSLYPSVMIKEYPDPNSARYKAYGDLNLIKEFEGITRVKLYCPYMKYPLLPMRINGKLIFPTGYISGVYTNVELRKALSLGYEIREIGETLYYKKTFYPFKEFVYDMYKKRNELKALNDPNEIIYKLIMNSLYGKFASKSLSETIFFNKEHLSNEGIDAVRINPNVVMKDDNNGMIINKRVCDEAYVLPILSSYTTAYARLVLYDYLVKYEGLYCDTDSLVTEQTIPESTALGKMKLEYPIIEGVIVKPKMYYLKIRDKKGEEKDIIKLKGVPKKILYKGEEIQINKEVFKAILEGETITYTKFTKLKEGVRRGISPNSLMDVEKFIRLIDNKREWLSSFDHTKLGDSKPLYIKEEFSNEIEGLKTECTISQT